MSRRCTRGQRSNIICIRYKEGALVDEVATLSTEHVPTTLGMWQGILTLALRGWTQTSHEYNTRDGQRLAHIWYNNQHTGWTFSDPHTQQSSRTELRGALQSSHNLWFERVRHATKAKDHSEEERKGKGCWLLLLSSQVREKRVEIQHLSHFVFVRLVFVDNKTLNLIYFVS